MGRFSSEDKIKGKIIEIENKTFHNMQTFDIKMPKVVTLVQILDEFNNKYLGFISGEITDIAIDQKISCTLKKTWNEYWIARTDTRTRVMPAELFTTNIGKTIYRKIDEYRLDH